MILTLKDFLIEDRVRVQPWTDAFMQGDVYGTVEDLGRAYVHVRMDRSQRLRRFYPELLEKISGPKAQGSWGDLQSPSLPLWVRFIDSHGFAVGVLSVLIVLLAIGFL